MSTTTIPTTSYPAAELRQKLANERAELFAQVNDFLDQVRWMLEHLPVGVELQNQPILQTALELVESVSEHLQHEEDYLKFVEHVGHALLQDSP